MPTQTLSQEQLQRNISRVLRTSRKHLGLNQGELAQRLDLSQATISKIEANLLTLDAARWILFCEQTGISLNAISLGYIDFSETLRLRSGANEHGFGLPKKYAAQKGSSVRAILPFKRYFEARYGETAWDRYLESVKIDPDFFLNLGNQFNVGFVFDLLATLDDKAKLNAKEIRRLVTGVGEAHIHGRVGTSYQGISMTLPLVSQLVRNAPFYDCNFNYQLEDSNKSGISLGIKPYEHLESHKKNPGFNSILCEYRKQYLAEFLHLGPQTKIEEVECIFRGADRCVFEIPQVA